MDEALFILRIVSGIVLLVAILRLFPSAVRGMRRDPRRLGLIWVLLCGLALNRLQFVTRGFVFEPAPAGMWESAWTASAYVFSILLWSGVIVAHRWYDDRAAG